MDSPAPYSLQPIQCSLSVVRMLANQIDPSLGIHILGNSSAPNEGVLLHEGRRPSVFCIEMRVSDPSWLATIRALRSQCPDVPVLVVISDAYDTMTLVNALTTGIADVHDLSDDNADRLNARLRALLPPPDRQPLRPAQEDTTPLADSLWKWQLELGEPVETVEASGFRVAFLRSPNRPGFITYKYVALVYPQGFDKPARSLALEGSGFGTMCLCEWAIDGHYNYGSVDRTMTYDQFRAWVIFMLLR